LDNPRRRCLRLLATAEAVAAVAPYAGRIQAEVVKRTSIEVLLPAGAVHQGLALLVAPLLDPGLDRLLREDGARSVIVLLDQVTDPHNVGAVLRSAAAFGAAAVILTERHAPAETGALAKAASGALEQVPLLRVTNLARTLDQLKTGGYLCLGLDGGAERRLDQVEARSRTALVLGAEGTGLRRLTRERCDILVKLPTSGPIRDLNVSNAAAVALYELARRA
jgi:23S rRNA (guanosine2251-2'-O)-methyltransferase